MDSSGWFEMPIKLNTALEVLLPIRIFRGIFLVPTVLYRWDYCSIHRLDTLDSNLFYGTMYAVISATLTNAESVYFIHLSNR